MLIHLLIAVVKFAASSGYTEAVIADQLELAAKRLREGRLFRGK